MTTDSTDQALLKGLAENDRKSIEVIYRQFYGMIQALVINNSGTFDDARDVFQDAMIVLYDKARSGSFELHAQLKTYLYAVSRRLWLKKLQTGRKYVSDLEHAEETIATGEDLALFEQRNDDFEIMDKALRHLGEPCKTLLETFYLQKKNMTDIAAEFGYSNADNAKNQKYKCLIRLKRIFFEQYNKS